MEGKVWPTRAAARKPCLTAAAPPPLRAVQACAPSAMAPPTTRTVVRYAQHGSSSVLEVVGDAPLPLRKKGQVLVENHATSVNPVDYKVGACGWLCDEGWD